MARGIGSADFQFVEKLLTNDGRLALSDDLRYCSNPPRAQTLCRSLYDIVESFVGEFPV